MKTSRLFKTLKNTALLLFLVGGGVASCLDNVLDTPQNAEPEKSPEKQIVQPQAEMTTLGRKLEDPYIIENMKTALDTLISLNKQIVIKCL